MYKVFLSNFGYYVDGLYPTVEKAVERGQKAGFEFTVWAASTPSKEGPAEDLIAAWSPIGGLRRYR